MFTNPKCLIGASTLRSVLLIATALAATACAVADNGTTHTPKVTLNLPRSWAAKTPSLTPPKGFLSMWTKDGANVSLAYAASPNIKTQVDLTVQGPETAHQLSQVFGAQNVTLSHAFSVCDGRKSGWFIASQTSFGTRTIVTESAYAPAQGGTVVATYTREKSLAEDPGVVAALHTLCAE